MPEQEPWENSGKDPKIIALQIHSTLVSMTSRNASPAKYATGS
jgi:hypothetical protein